MQYRTIFFPGFLFLLSACGGDNSSAPRTDDFENVISISDVGATINIEDVQAPHSVDINITGSNNTISIINNTSVGRLSIEGANNLINVENGVSINICVFGGSDNTLNKPSSLLVTCTMGGLGNSIMNF